MRAAVTGGVRHAGGRPGAAGFVHACCVRHAGGPRAQLPAWLRHIWRLGLAAGGSGAAVRLCIVRGCDIGARPVGHADARGLRGGVGAEVERHATHADCGSGGTHRSLCQQPGMAGPRADYGTRTIAAKQCHDHRESIQNHTVEQACDRRTMHSRGRPSGLISPSPDVSEVRLSGSNGTSLTRRLGPPGLPFSLFHHFFSMDSACMLAGDMLGLRLDHHTNRSCTDNAATWTWGQASDRCSRNNVDVEAAAQECLLHMGGIRLSLLRAWLLHGVLHAMQQCSIMLPA